MSFLPNTPTRGLKLRPQGQRYYFSTTRHFFREEDIPRLRSLVPELTDATVAEPDESGTRAQQIANSDIRASRVGFIEPSADADWLYRLISSGIAHHNQTYYDYAIEGIETVQFSVLAITGHTWIGELALYLAVTMFAASCRLPYS
jgi:hypothetical protein